MCKVGGPRSGRILIKINKYILFCNKVPIDGNLSAITILCDIPFDQYVMSSGPRHCLCRPHATRKDQPHTHTHKTSPFAVGFFGSLEKDDFVLILSVSLSNQF